MWWRQTFAVIVGQQFWPFTILSSNNEVHAVFTFYLFYTLLRCLPPLHCIMHFFSYIIMVVAVLAKDLCLTGLRTKVLLHALPFVTFLKTCWLWLVWKCMMLLALLFMFSFGLHSPSPPCLHPLFYITVGCHTLQTISVQQCGFNAFPITCWLWLVGKCMMFLCYFGLHSPPPCIHPLLYIMVALRCKCFCPVMWEEGVAHFAICCPPQNLLVLTGLEVHDVHVLLPPPIYIYIMVAILCKHFCLAVWERRVLPILPFVTFLETCWLWLVCKCMMFRLLF